MHDIFAVSDMFTGTSLRFCPSICAHGKSDHQVSKLLAKSRRVVHKSGLLCLRIDLFGFPPVKDEMDPRSSVSNTTADSFHKRHGTGEHSRDDHLAFWRFAVELCCKGC
jgi:hypothetical protein